MDSSGSILDLTTSLSQYWQNMTWKTGIASVLDVLIVAVIFYWLYRFLRETKGVRILYGLLFIVALWLISKWLNLQTVNFLIRMASTAIVVAIPIVFQPELRSLLEKLGRTSLVGDIKRIRRDDMAIMIDIVSESVSVLMHEKIGALIVIPRKTGLKEYIETGVTLNARLSTDLLLTIFTPDAAMHDGAVIIQGMRLVAAKVILPLSGNKFDYRLGTRHRAAVGLTNQCDAIVIVVSAERGEISLAQNGQLTKNILAKDIHNNLIALLMPNTKKTQDKKK